MKPEDFIKEGMFAELFDYAVRPDKTIVAVLEVSSDSYEGDLELTREEIEAAIAYIQDKDIDDEVAAAFHDAIDLIERAEAQADPTNPDLNSLLFGGNPNDPQP